MFEVENKDGSPGNCHLVIEMSAMVMDAIAAVFGKRFGHWSAVWVSDLIINDNNRTERRS